MNRKSFDKTILEVHMLGGFSLVYGKKPIPNNYSGTSKMMQLFQILFENRQPPVEEKGINGQNATE